jgi:rod shape-determining protein MreC
MLIPQRFTGIINSAFIGVFSNVLGTKLEIGAEHEMVSKPDSTDFVPRAEYDQLWSAYQNQYSDLLETHRRLEAATGFRADMPKAGDKFIMADVIKKEPGQQLLVNRGTIDGIKPGQYVASEGAIIGVVSAATSSWARITLILNNTRQIPVRIVRQGKDEYIRVNMLGDGVSRCKIGYVSTELDVKPGDIVYASPGIEYLETPRIAGTITEVVRDAKNPLLWDITITPAASFDNIKKVAVIVVAPMEDANR